MNNNSHVENVSQEDKINSMIKKMDRSLKIKKMKKLVSDNHIFFRENFSEICKEIELIKEGGYCDFISLIVVA